MNLLKWNETHEETVVYESIGRRAWRNVLHVAWFGIGLEREYKRIDEADSEWRTIQTFFGVSITSHFRLGMDHVYYDGPHCMLSIGFLHLYWDGNPWTGDCKKCWGDEDE